MKITVSKYLNSRIGQPSVNAACNFYKNPGDTIEIDNVVFGSEIDGNSIWYRSKDDGCYYWSGGIEEIEFEIEGLVITDDFLFKIIKDIQKNYFGYFSKTIEGYTGCGIGHKNLKEANGLALAFFVSEKKGLKAISKPAPEFILHKGFKIITDVVEMKGRLHYQKPPVPLDPDPDNDDPMLIGGKVYQSNYSDYFGTRTLKVAKDNKSMLLGCFHVMAFSHYNSSSSQAVSITEIDKITVEIPDQSGGGTVKLNVIEGAFDGNVDYALAELPFSRIIANQLDGTIINRFANALEIEMMWNTQVESLGRVSSLQQGRILYTSSEKKVDSTTFSNIIITEKISTDGDSGAPVVRDDLFLGYVFGGDDANYSFLIPAYKLEKLNCTLLNS